MNNMGNEREVIPAGEHETGWRHLIPMVLLLIDRGHPILDEEDEFGFFHSPAGYTCELGRKFTEDDWAAINERFVVPDNIVFLHGLIQDNANRVRMMGVDLMTEGGEVFSFDEWEERERQAGRR